MASSQRPLTVVLGNESGDLDSVVGSICLAFALNNHPSLNFKPAVPALNFDLKDLPLRTDVHKFLQSFNISTDLLLTADHSCANTDSFVNVEDDDVRLVLFDHNLLTEPHKQCSTKVVGIVDHHKNEQQYLDTTRDLRLIKEIGSASTLVAGLCRNNNIPMPFASFLAAPIIIDCENFDLSRNRATPEDIEVFAWLESQMTSQRSTTELFTQLKAWRADIFCLSVEENLRRDFKLYGGKGSDPIGFSSIPCSRATFLNRYPGVVMEACISFLKARGLEALFLTFAGTDNGGHQRDLVALGKPSTLEHFIEMSSSSSLFQLVDETTVEGFRCVSYSLTDTTMSRKKLAPLIRSAL
eukprot:gene10756-7485_t